MAHPLEQEAAHRVASAHLQLDRRQVSSVCGSRLLLLAAFLCKEEVITDLRTLQA